MKQEETERRVALIEMILNHLDDLNKLGHEDMVRAHWSLISAECKKYADPTASISEDLVNDLHPERYMNTPSGTYKRQSTVEYTDEQVAKIKKSYEDLHNNLHPEVYKNPPSGAFKRESSLEYTDAQVDKMKDLIHEAADFAIKDYPGTIDYAMPRLMVEFHLHKLKVCTTEQ